MISFPAFDVTQYRVRLTKHAADQAWLRCVDADDVMRTIRSGRIERFGKHGVKFISKGKSAIICVGEVSGDAIKIITVTKG